MLETERTVSNQAQVSFRGNRYCSLLPGHAREVVAVRHTLGSTSLDVTDRTVRCWRIICASPIAPGRIRLDEHVAALSKVVLAAFSDREPCRRKTRRPPSAAARADAERIRRTRTGLGDGEHVVIDFADYVGQARPFNSSDDRAGQR